MSRFRMSFRLPRFSKIAQESLYLATCFLRGLWRRRRTIIGCSLFLGGGTAIYGHLRPDSETARRVHDQLWAVGSASRIIYWYTLHRAHAQLPAHSPTPIRLLYFCLTSVPSMDAHRILGSDSAIVGYLWRHLNEGGRQCLELVAIHNLPTVLASSPSLPIARQFLVEHLAQLPREDLASMLASGVGGGLASSSLRLDQSSIQEVKDMLKSYNERIRLVGLFYADLLIRSEGKLGASSSLIPQLCSHPASSASEMVLWIRAVRAAQGGLSGYSRSSLDGLVRQLLECTKAKDERVGEEARSLLKDLAMAGELCLLPGGLEAIVAARAYDLISSCSSLDGVKWTKNVLKQVATDVVVTELKGQKKDGSQTRDGEASPAHSFPDFIAELQPRSLSANLETRKRQENAALVLGRAVTSGESAEHILRLSVSCLEWTLGATDIVQKTHEEDLEGGRQVLDHMPGELIVKPARALPPPLPKEAGPDWKEWTWKDEDKVDVLGRLQSLVKLYELQEAETENKEDVSPTSSFDQPPKHPQAYRPQGNYFLLRQVVAPAVVRVLQDTNKELEEKVTEEHLRVQLQCTHLLVDIQALTGFDPVLEGESQSACVPPIQPREGLDWLKGKVLPVAARSELLALQYNRMYGRTAGSLLRRLVPFDPDPSSWTPEGRLDVVWVHGLQGGLFSWRVERLDDPQWKAELKEEAVLSAEKMDTRLALSKNMQIQGGKGKEGQRPSKASKASPIREIEGSGFESGSGGGERSDKMKSPSPGLQVIEEVIRERALEGTALPSQPGKVEEGGVLSSIPTISSLTASLWGEKKKSVPESIELLSSSTKVNPPLSPSEVPSDFSLDLDPAFELWPLKYLKDDLESRGVSVRQIGFRFDAPLWKAQRKQYYEEVPLPDSIDWLASNLGKALRDANIGQDRPVVFITHSMGGLITKRLLVEDPQVRKNVLGVLFLSTPHIGSPVAAFSHYARDIRLAPEYVGQLSPREEYLHSLQTEYSKKCAHIMVLNMAEEAPADVGGGLSLVVVPPESSDLTGDLPRHEFLKVKHAHHYNISKVRDKDHMVDPRYVKVREFIEVSSTEVQEG